MLALDLDAVTQVESPLPDGLAHHRARAGQRLPPGRLGIGQLEAFMVAADAVVENVEKETRHAVFLGPADATLHNVGQDLRP